MASPIEQFEIKNVLDLDLGIVDASFTNSALLMVIAVILITVFLVM